MKRIISFALICSIAVMMLATFGLVSADSTDLSDFITYDAPDDAFDYYIEGDPQDITDEEFFGVWNKDGKMWKNKPFLKYDEFDGLQLVEEAVQDGDYALAKEELLKYYRSVKNDRIILTTNHPGAQTKLEAEALGKNVYTVNGKVCGFIQDIITVNNDWYEYSVDVTNRFLGDYMPECGFAFMSVDKFLTQAEIYSRESDYPPRLELVVNGVSISLEALKDATVRGGIYSEQNYGSEEVLRVQESGQYQNFNENTYQAYVAFDISFLKDTDVVESAVLKFNARNASGTGNKEVVVYYRNNTNYKEEEVNFDFFASECLMWSCNDLNAWDYVTSNDTSIKGKACYYHRGNALNPIASLYDYTKNEEYAFTYIRQHMALVNSIGFDRKVFNQLDLGVQVGGTPESVFKVIDSEHMTGDRLTAIIKNLWLQADYLVNSYYGEDTNNWASYATLGVYSLISRFPELEVYDDWFEKTKVENTRVVGGFTFDDGMCIEVALSYVSTLLSTLSSPINIAEVTGNELPYEDTVMEQARDIVRTLIYSSGPDFSGMNIGDSQDYTSNYKEKVKVWYNTVFSDDLEFEYVATNGKSGKLPDNPTTHYPAGLRTYMRSAWADPDALVMSFTAIGEGSHGHRDMLSISMFAYGVFLLTDQGYGAALTDGTASFSRNAGQHNLVTINGEDYLGKISGVEEAFESNTLYDFIEYSGDFTAYATQQRSVMYLKKQKFWIVTDFADAYNDTEVNSYEQNWHMLPNANWTVDPETYAIRSNMQSANVLLVPVDTAGLSSNREYALFAPGYGSFIETEKAVLKQSVAGDSKFTTLIIPMDSNEDFEVNVMPVDIGENKNVINSFYCSIKDKNTGKLSYYYYYHHNEPENKQVVKIGDYETDATTMLIEIDEEYNFVSMFLMDATFLNDASLGTENTRFKSNTPVKAIAYEEGESIVKIHSSSLNDIHELNDLTVFVGDKQGFKLNGEFVTGKKSGGYLYFGDEPIIVGGELPGQNAGNNSTTSGSHGMGGSGGGSATSSPPKKEEHSTEIEVIEPFDDEIEIPDNINIELENHWGKSEIKTLYKKGIVTGDDEGLRLKDTITRAEFTALVVRTLGLETENYEDTFSDVSQYNWYAKYIATAYNNGLINGSNGIFRPNDTITREEICKIIASAIEVETERKVLDFYDYKEISEWALESVEKVYSLGIVNGMGDGNFAPQNSALREQAFAILARIIIK